MERSPQHGLSLVEVVVSLGIFMLIMIAIVDLNITNSALVRSQSATLDVIGSASDMMSHIVTYGLQASQVAGSHAFSGTTYTSGTSTLVLKLPSIDASGNTVDGQNDFIAYYASGTSAYQVTDAGVGSVRPSGTRKLSDTLTSLTFTYDDLLPTLATKVDADVQTQEASGKVNANTHVTDTIYLRNK